MYISRQLAKEGLCHPYLLYSPAVLMTSKGKFDFVEKTKALVINLRGSKGFTLVTKGHNRVY